MQIQFDGPRLIMKDVADRRRLGFLQTSNGRRLLLALLLMAVVMQVFEGRFIAWDIPADWRPIVAALVAAAYAVLELYTTFADHKVLTATFDAADRTVVLRSVRGCDTLERRAPFSVIAGIEIADLPAGRWRPGDDKYLLQARLTSGEVWPLTTPGIQFEQLADCAAAIELRLAASL